MKKIFRAPPPPNLTEGEAQNDATPAAGAVKVTSVNDERTRRLAARRRANIIYLGLLALAIVVPAIVPVFGHDPMPAPDKAMTPQNSMEAPPYDNLPAEPAEGRDIHSGRSRH